ncbi:MAG: hypothetical protein ACI4WG_03040 [Erysipelotrichaceae bacterium]
MNKKMSFILLAIEIVLLVLCFVMLPQQVIIQIGMDGSPTNIVSKTVALIILAALAVLAFICLYNAEENDKKGYIIAAVFVFVALLTLIINRG